MITEDSTDEITEINWDCYDGTDDSVITIDGVSVQTNSQPAQNHVAQLRQASRQQLGRETAEKPVDESSILDRFLKFISGRD